MAQSFFSPVTNPLAWVRFLLAAALGLALDQWSKIHSFATLMLSKSVVDGRVHVESRTYAFIPDWLEFHVTANHGAVFGLGQGRRVLFVIVSVAAIGFIFYLFSASGRQRIYQIILGMLLAGVLGNLYDRVVLGYVRDMIFALPKWDVFPWIFNVADSLLCVGVALMILHSIFHSSKKPTPEPNAGEIPAQ